MLKIHAAVEVQLAAYTCTKVRTGWLGALKPPKFWRLTLLLNSFVL